MSSISAGTSSGTALVSTGDTTGALVFKTGASATTAMTIGADQSVTFVGAVSGIPGSGGTTASGSVVLTSASTGAQSITTTNYGQSVTLPNATTLSDGACLYTINNLGAYPLKIINNAGSTLGFVAPNSPITVGLADNSTAAGTWSLVGAEPYAVVAQTVTTALYDKTIAVNRSVIIDSTRSLLLLQGLTDSYIYAIVYDSSTQTFGAVTLIRSAVVGSCSAILSATNQVLICSLANTAMVAVTLTISGTAITVNTAATATLSAGDNGTYSSTNLIAVGTSWVFSYAVTGANQIRALTVSGTTVTIGAATALSGTTLNNVYLAAVSSSVLLTTSTTSATTFFATPYTISGSTITAGTGATYASAAASGYRIQPISNGVRWAVVICDSAATSAIGLIISVAGTTASISSVTLATITNSTGLNNAAIGVSGSKLIFVPSQVASTINILTDTAGTASAGTAIPNAAATSNGVFVSANATTNLATFVLNTGGSAQNSVRLIINFSTASPTISALDYLNSNATNAFSVAGVSLFNSSRSNQLLYGNISYTYAVQGVIGQKAIAVSENSFYAFVPKLMQGGTSYWALSANKAWCYIPAAAGSTVYGLLQVIESIT